MPTVRAEIHIPKPPAEVYAAAKDLEGLKPYLKDVETLKVLEDDGRTSRSEWVASAMGKKVRWVEVEEWDDAGLRNRFYSPEGDFDRYEGTWVFEAAEGGTRVTLTIEYELNLPIFGGLLQKLVKKLMQENAESFLEGLKERCLA
ncbi:type II toxin-antitoxin system RatA family toxin [Marinithermus hydrothermalis]|uniref:Polyketide cyclase/dehydrase n=1 Tax=Marinithermus hydrothermalis (strain DSM 14884 / JCM 11576 / T1) TaxID=869210 RepID=F2NP94_MARHT|nr:SRPBCC family protein [Marinithermus hydrothermalis]AEB11895.1 Polyketide cyclase/dehydrase [Marinithermus hydrothermalis DSM 14884]